MFAVREGELKDLGAYRIRASTALSSSNEGSGEGAAARALSRPRCYCMMSNGDVDVTRHSSVVAAYRGDRPKGSFVVDSSETSLRRPVFTWRSETGRVERVGPQVLTDCGPTAAFIVAYQVNA